MTDNYDDIIQLPHPVSKNHPPMPMKNRAAQFAPFSALTGYGDAIKESVRMNEAQYEETEDEEWEEYYSASDDIL
ncbi:MAG: hypothetical protein IKR71_09995 [Bacteroidales bacterium]|jgi:hypothetical protein|nr:hypothetical protein [Bacteroidales bacterium]